MKNFLIISLLFISLKTFCQRNQPPVLDNNRYQFGMAESRIEIVDKDTIFITKSMFKSNSTNNIEEVEKRYKGTPIFNNAWFPNCTIYLGSTPTKGAVAYNLLNREVQFSTGDVNKPIAIKPDSFTVNSQKFIQLIKTVKDANNIFYQLVFKSNKLSLYKAFHCNYRPKVYGQNTSYEINTDNFEGAFIKYSTLHILENGELSEIKANSGFYKQFGDKKSELEKYAKSNNLSLKKESDLVSILKYYSSL